MNPITLESVFEDIRRVGAATSAKEQALTLHATLRDRVERIRSRTVSLPSPSRPRVICLEWIEPLMVSANWMPELVEIAGGQNGLTTAGARTGYSQWRDIAEFDPQILVVMPCGFDLDRAFRESRVLFKLPGWNEIAAVKQHQVYVVDGTAYFNRSARRIVDSLEILASVIHPALFQGLSAPREAWARLE